MERLFTEGVKEAGERVRTAGVEATEDVSGRKFSVTEPNEDASKKQGASTYSVNRKFSISEETPTAPLQKAVQRMYDREKAEAEKSGQGEPTQDKTVQDHILLADTMMGAVQSEQEYRAVKSYKAKAEEMVEAEARRADLRKKTAEPRCMPGR